MIKLDGMLMIGSAGANVGKTELACAVISKFGESRDIVGIKVTTIRARDGRCPRGGQGCGVCSSLEGDFCITEETDPNSNKDTARLLAAGAKRVFWLRVMQTHLKEAINALLEVIGPDAVTICESNSLRKVVEPGLFLIVRDRSSRAWKNSARQVRNYADKIVVSDGNSFDLDIGRIKLANGKWLLQEHATAIIMAGGDSNRMGIDKRMLPVAGRAMIQVIYEQLRRTFDQILISANQTQGLVFLDAQVVSDRIAGQGPLMGIASALEASANELNFVVACDIPRIDLRFVRRMLAEAAKADIVIPTRSTLAPASRRGYPGQWPGLMGQATGEGKHEPLFAVYRKSALDAINQTLASGKRKISEVLPHCKVKYIELDVDLPNLNTMADYEEFCKSYNAQV